MLPNYLMEEVSNQKLVILQQLQLKVRILLAALGSFSATHKKHTLLTYKFRRACYIEKRRTLKIWFRTATHKMVIGEIRQKTGTRIAGIAQWLEQLL